MNHKFHWPIQECARDTHPSRSDFVHFHAVFSKKIAKQECIPVGCVPPTCCPYLRARTARGWGVYLVLGRVYLVAGVYLVPGGVPGPGGCTWSQGGVPGQSGYLVLGVYLVLGGVPGPRGCTCPGNPPVNRMTDRCQNITLPQTSFAGGNNNFVNSLTLAYTLWEIMDRLLIIFQNKKVLPFNFF